MNFTPEEEEELRRLGKSPITSQLSSALTPEEQAEIQALGASPIVEEEQPTVVEEEPPPVEEKGFLESLADVSMPGTTRPKRLEEMTPEERRVAADLPTTLGELHPRWPQTEGITPARIGRTYENIPESGAQTWEGLKTVFGSPIEKGWGTEEKPGPFRQMKEMVLPSSGGVPLAPLAEGGLRAGAEGFFGPEAREWVQKNIIGGRPTKRSLSAEQFVGEPLKILGGIAGGDLEPLLEKVEEDPAGTAFGAAATLAGAPGVNLGTRVIKGVKKVGEKTAELGKTGFKTLTQAQTGVGVRAFEIAEEIGGIKAKKAKRIDLTPDETERLRQYTDAQDIGEATPYSQRMEAEGIAGKEYGVGLKKMGVEIARELEYKIPAAANEAWSKTRKGWKLTDVDSPVDLNVIRNQMNEVLEARGVKTTITPDGKTELDFGGITGLTKQEANFLKNATEEIDKIAQIDPSDFTSMHQQLRLIRKLKDKTKIEGWGDTSNLMEGIHGIYRKELGNKIDGFNEAQERFSKTMDFIDEVRIDFLDVTSKKKRQAATKIASNKVVSRLNNVLSGRIEDTERLATLRMLKDVTGVDYEAAVAGIQTSLKSPRSLSRLDLAQGLGFGGLAGYDMVKMVFGETFTGAATAGIGLAIAKFGGKILMNSTFKNPKRMGRMFEGIGFSKEMANAGVRNIERMKKRVGASRKLSGDALDALTLGSAFEMQDSDLLTNLGRARQR